MSLKIISIISIVFGAILLVISIFADIISLGGDLNTFGWKQITGVIVGVGLILVGILLNRKEN